MKLMIWEVYKESSTDIEIQQIVPVMKNSLIYLHDIYSAWPDVFYLLFKDHVKINVLRKENKRVQCFPWESTWCTGFILYAYHGVMAITLIYFLN